MSDDGAVCPYPNTLPNGFCFASSQAKLPNVYIVHPIEVSEIVSAMTDDEEVICAAVLHDTIEDCRGITKDVLKLRFGDRVAELAAQESEDKTLSWKERMSATIARLKDAQREVQLIGLADKLSNMRDIDRDYPVVGEMLWERFRMYS